MSELRRAQELLGTKDLASTIEKLAGFYTDRKDPLKEKTTKKKPTRPPLAESKSPESQMTKEAEKSHTKTAAAKKTNTPDHTPQRKSRYVAALVRRMVYQKSGGYCTYVDSSTGRRCSARRHLEMDHIKAFARGGDQSPKNLQVLCRSHNLMRARDEFGEWFMARFGAGIFG